MLEFNKPKQSRYSSKLSRDEISKLDLKTDEKLDWNRIESDWDNYKKQQHLANTAISRMPKAELLKKALEAMHRMIENNNALTYVYAGPQVIPPLLVQLPKAKKSTSRQPAKEQPAKSKTQPKRQPIPSNSPAQNTRSKIETRKRSDAELMLSALRVNGLSNSPQKPKQPNGMFNTMPAFQNNLTSLAWLCAEEDFDDQSPSGIICKP